MEGLRRAPHSIQLNEYELNLLGLTRLLCLVPVPPRCPACALARSLHCSVFSLLFAIESDEIK